MESGQPNNSGDIVTTGKPLKIGLFGGSFDPPTTAHLIAAEWVREKQHLDEIWFLPTNQNPIKQSSTITPTELRLEMIASAIADNPRFRMETTEIDRGGVSYTVDTLRNLKQQHPDKTFYFIMGGDALSEIKRWKEHDALLKLASIIALTRPLYDASRVDPEILNYVNLLEFPALAISSTLVRESLARGKSVRYLVPDPVLAIIEREHLYSTSL